ncbi:MAG: biopolymer transporter ExbD [Chthoniobacter sp.]|nr:biopolymer transporter ExbD [Chthoniobacter sp.]
MKRLDLNSNEGTIGFQIAPMIDVVFVIMLFFMVMAGAVKVEKELPSQLPGNAETQGETPMADEMVIAIAENGEITLNDEPMDSPTSTTLPALKNTLLRLKQASDQSKTPVLVTVLSEPLAKYSRTVDVLDSLAVAGISNVTFTVNEPEE